jgi:predicted metal-dependent phosphotriesterase family hydrolase
MVLGDPCERIMIYRLRTALLAVPTSSVLYVLETLIPALMRHGPIIEAFVINTVMDIHRVL